jgi:thiol-disulfide isomerase/thioredoxin
MNGPTRRAVLSTIGAGAIAGLAGCLSAGGAGSDGDGTAGGTTTGGESTSGAGGGETDWRTIELQTVRGDETFTVADLASDGVVLVETFAVWCSNCLRQQKTMIDFHAANPAVTTVAVDIDPNEDAPKVREHADRHGFDWRYAVAPSEWTRSVTSEFGSSMANAPSVPMLRVCGPDDVTRLKDGQKSVSFLEDAVSEC